MLIVEKDPKSIVTEAFKTLRTNIQFSSIDNNIKTILVTSPSPSEGKSTTEANLALTFSQGGKKVLVIDCDLRKPTVHKKFKISNKIGLSNFMVGEATLDNCIIKYNENMHILTSGNIPPNPAELLASRKMKEFLGEMRNVYDVVIIDSPPVLAVTDAQVLSTMVDGVLLVVASGQSEKEACIKAKDLLTKVKANILGAVISKMPVDKRKGYNYGYYYYYYGDEEKSDNKKKKGRRVHA